jgi:hypothetical protein
MSCLRALVSYRFDLLDGHFVNTSLRMHEKLPIWRLLRLGSTHERNDIITSLIWESRLPDFDAWNSAPSRLIPEEVYVIVSSYRG